MRALWEMQNVMDCIPDELWDHCYGGAPLWRAADLYALHSYAVTFLALILASTTLGRRGWQRLPRRAAAVATPVLMLASLLLCTAYLVDGSYNPFLYFRF